MKPLIHPGHWLPWLGALAIVTAVMLPARPYLDKAHVALIYLLLVLGGSSRSGRIAGFALSVSAFLCFNFFFVAPLHSLLVNEPLDWLVLASFLLTSGVAAQLLARARSEAATARDWAGEVDKLSALGAEALHAGRAGEALIAIAGVIRRTLEVTRCELYIREATVNQIRLAAMSGDSPANVNDDAGTAVAKEPGGDDFRIPAGIMLTEWVASSGRPALERMDGTTRVGSQDAPDEATAIFDLGDARMMLLPLRVGDRVAGVLRIVSPSGLKLDASRRRLLHALTYYAALGVERVRLEAEAEHADALREADALKDALLASVSHDLRTPLTTIKALAHDMRREGDERAATIEQEADRLNRFVADLLDLSRIAGKALSLTPEINAVEDLLGVAIDRVSGTLNGRDLTVHLDTAEPLLLGRFDFVHSLRILVNLIENALKYAPPGSAVELSATGAMGALEIVVADRGPGVSVAESERIFEAFYRPEGGLPDSGGAGLGLSIARQLAEAQGGTLRYEPRGGGGSSFILRLPIANVDELQLAAAQALPAGSAIER